MGQSYDQLSLRERVKIELWHREGRSLRWIGRQLGRSAATISRELRRNARPTKQWCGSYDGERAHGLALRRRRWDARYKLARQPALRDMVRQRLAMGQSPEQIAGRLAREHGGTLISHESIYRFVYHRSAQKDYWHRLLPRAKNRRGRLGLRGGSSVSFIKLRRPLAQRPAEADDRATPGHWEADLMAFSRYGQYVLVTHERSSRILTIDRLSRKTARAVVQALVQRFGPLPRLLRRSLTFDNGTEFALHFELTDRLGLATFFCDPHAPWQKGGIENAIGRMRKILPRKSDLATIDQGQIRQLVEHYNNTPRKCLAFRTPNEVFSELLNRVALQT
ncbi:IS30 family transposase [Stappia sp. F7233]|uniref:IS30 family transposase n=2 Tax=Stappia albiluteola TaxID=2758565 RepID=A0A839AAZ1_9HYPH|nr:IS30 family transposase [Stappia albiluteola]MBA5776307.1 IS30 family transposase [Stappia albiluteola]MBA5776356.1 IS30 family transposase [Stappia albiluteola]MBA5776938.1 IS30 family transposase [Stappia albiluteola]MBA5777076.1 IS30 family transposase [Stappia albiluteola]MBA5777077.1 IS30 family transposase [Stappia albiluteola]